MIGMAAKDLQYMLVRWIGEETLSVLPSCKSRGGDIPIVGLTGDFRWSGRYYEGEILALSGRLSSYIYSYVASYYRAIASINMLDLYS